MEKQKIFLKSLDYFSYIDYIFLDFQIKRWSINGNYKNNKRNKIYNKK